MLQLAVTADTYAELKEKTFVALGITEPAQASLALAVEKTSSPMAALAQGAAPKRTRRTVAEIEADRQKANAGAATKEVIENNFKAADEAAEVIIDPTLDDETPVEADYTHDSCKALMKEVIAKHGMERAIAIIKRFKVAKVPELAEKDLEMFTFACKDALK